MYDKKIQQGLKKKKIEVGDEIEVVKKDKSYSGILMPRIDMGDRSSIVLKLKNGYNIGLKYSKDVEIKLLSKLKKKSKDTKKTIIHDKKKPIISILSMGGTIASKVDYKTGGVIPSFTAEDLVESIPELAEIANIHGRQIENILSGNMKFSDYKKLINEIKKELKKNCEGIIITHGTDTMHYTSSALAFALEDLPVPVILVGSQRSSDRASSDGPLNLICAAQFIVNSDFGEVGLCMHATESDDFCLIYPACKTRKMHTSCRDAFRSVNTEPWGLVSPDGKIKFFKKDYKRMDKKRKIKIKNKFCEDVAILKVHPNMSPNIFDFLTKSGCKGLVLEGTGLGHAPYYVRDSIRKFIKKGIVVMTSQCLNGRINMNVYSYGRRLEEMGVLNGNDMLPETAFIKLSWLLGNCDDRDEVEKLMLKNLRGEINERSEF